MNRKSRFGLINLLAAILTHSHVEYCDAGVTLNEIQSLNVSGGYANVVYSNQHNLLFLRSSNGSEIRVINAANGSQVSTRAPSSTGTFSDYSFSPSGRYLYAVDYGGTVIGYGDPLYPTYINRYDLVSNTWTVAQSPKVGYRIAPVDDNRVLLLEYDQWVDMSLLDYAPGTASVLSTRAAGYSGNIEYSPALNRIFHNETGISSTDITAYNLSGNTISTAVQSAAGAAYGSTYSLLSSDGLTLYYNRAGLQASDLSKTTATFSENITAASPTIAFGTSRYFNPSNGALLGTVPFTPSTWTVGANGTDVWALQANGTSNSILRRFLIANSYAWTGVGGGSWNTTTQWENSTLPDGMDNSADFSQTTLLADAVVTLDGTRTIGGIITGDLGNTRSWTINSGTGGDLNL